ncbi:FeoA family protein [Vibrio hannami]|uniref:FeoA family protein n=1 Tax=Vibrio hannami TaxID=2717094 RepID=UPI00240EEE39|nr:FeoA family protein [Vibrio hannami]MDG3085907.1 FeoA family protein [Vibrio hannami]
MSIAIFNQLPGKVMTFMQGRNKKESDDAKSLLKAKVSQEYEIKEVVQGDAEMVAFLFTLGCFKGETITLISVLSETYVISIKDSRYSIDSELAKLIILV